MQITEIKRRRKIENKKIRVAAYARTSSDKDAALNSLSSQVSHYNELISKHLDWEFAGIFVDEGISGVKEGRPEFERLLQACREGKIDMVVTKSVTRFARNTLVLLREVRNLKELGVDVYFELENIHTMSITGEIMLTAFASFAEDQAKRISDYVKWSVKKRFEKGIPTHNRYYGYKMKGDDFVIVPEEAVIVKKIFEDYLTGKGRVGIVKELKRLKIPTLHDWSEWTPTTIRQILCNEKYAGDIVLQKTYVPSFREKHTVKNNNKLPKYLVEDNHDPIISKELYYAVQDEMKRRGDNPNYRNQKNKTQFTSLLTCAKCGKHFGRKIYKEDAHFWRCQTYNNYGKSACSNKQINEGILILKTEEVLGVKNLNSIDLREYIKEIKCYENRILEFVMKDGSKKCIAWSLKSRSESWTEDMKEQARAVTMQRNRIQAMR